MITRILLLVIFIFSSCITPIVVDKLHNFSIVGYGKPPKKITARFIKLKNFPFATEPSDTTHIWLATVSAFEIEQAIPNLNVNLSLVNAFGEAVQGQFLHPTEVVSNENGRNPIAIQLSINEPGVYRIKLQYRDERSISTGYSQPIIITNDLKSLKHRQINK